MTAPRTKNGSNVTIPWRLITWATTVVIAFGGPIVWLIGNQLRDNDFRSQGPRFTAEDAKQQTKIIVREITDAINERIQNHERIGGHDVMDTRVRALERRTEKVEVRETEALEKMEEHIKRYVQHVIRDGQ